MLKLSVGQVNSYGREVGTSTAEPDCYAATRFMC